MRTVTLGSLRTHTRRYVAALLAVTIAVGFVVVTNALASATKNGLSAGVERAYDGADLVVGDEYGMPEEDVDTVLAEAARSGDAASVIGSSWTTVVADGTSWGDQVNIGTVADQSALRHQKISAGRSPEKADEALVKASQAESSGLEVGDTLTIGTDQKRDVRVVGLTEGTTYLDAAVYVPWETMSAIGGIPDAVSYAVRDGDSADSRAETLRGLVSAEVQSREDYVDQRVVMVNQGVDLISYLLLLFAAIAGFVALLVIANTFTILFAQRTNDFALLRCVGATRRQVLRSVRTESLLLALVASTVGVVGGAGAGYGLAAGLRVFADNSIGAVELSAAWLVPAFVGGVVTTLVAAWWPTRAVLRVSPLAALRPATDVSTRTRAGRARIALGTLVALGGAVVLAGAVVAESMPVLLLGGMASFVGVLLLGPVIVPALLRLLGRLVGRTGPSVRIATGNTVRNPRRSAATTASLLVGVTLATAVLTGMSSARSVLHDEMAAEHPVDVTLTGGSAISPTTLDRVDGLPDVDEVAGITGTVGTVGDQDGLTILAPTPEQRELGHDQEVLTAEEGEVLIPTTVWSSFPDGLPDEITVTADGRELTLRAQSTPATWGDAVVVSPDTLADLGGGDETLALWVRATDGADSDDLGGAVGAAVRESGLETTNALQNRAWVDTQLDVLALSVLGLLGVAIVIALVGIANTVGLSVLERGREHALLRALGLTRRQLRRVLAAEGVMLALVAAVVGTALGVTYGWLGVRTVITPVLPEASVSVPWLQLAGVVLAAAVAGLAACVLPARRAARVAPAQGLTLD